MKSKKLWLPTVILAAAVLLTVVYSLVTSIAIKPLVTEYEFPFSITYELHGETVTIDDVYAVRYDRNGGYADSKTRIYVGQIGDMSEDTTDYILEKDTSGRIELMTNFYPDYMMGDSEYDYFDDEAFEPRILYYDAEETEYTDEETLAAQGVKLVSWEYPTPIENSFAFSHISILSGAVVLPALLIAFLAWLATAIFVKKESDYVRKPIDIVALVFNLFITVFLLPYLTACACLIDIAGDNESFFHQIFYFIPALTVLGITASVALRRKGFHKSGFVAQFIGPAIFAILLIVFAIQGLL